MAQQQKIPAWKIITYRIAKWSLAITVWIWTAVIITFLVQFIPNLLLVTNPATTLPTTWAGQAVQWLQAPSNVFYEEAAKLIARGVAILLVVIPPLAYLLKRALRNVELEGFNKLIDILDQDTISPKLEDLSQQLWYQHREQLNTLTNGLLHVDSSIKQSLNSHLSHLSTLLQQQLDLQQQSAQTLQAMQATLKQSTISTQLQRLENDLREREQRIQQGIANDLRLISSSLKQIQDQLGTAILLNQQNGSTQSGLLTTDPDMVAVVPPSQLNQQRHTGVNAAPDPNTAFLDN